MSVTSFAFSGSSGSTVNDVRGLVQTAGWKRYTKDVQLGHAVIKFDAFRPCETKPFTDDGDTIEMPKMEFIMEGKILSIEGEFPNGISKVEFTENERPKCTYAYRIMPDEQAYMFNELGSRFGIRGHLIEEPFMLPIQYTTDYFDGIDRNGYPITLLNVNVVRAHDTAMNSICKNDLGESLVVTECYAIPYESEMQYEDGEFARQEKEEQALAEAAKAEEKNKPLDKPQAAAQLTREEVALNEHSERVNEYVSDIISEQDARRKAHDEELEEKRKKEEAERLAEQAALEAAKAPKVEIKKPEPKKSEPAFQHQKFDQQRLNDLLGVGPDDAGPSDSHPSFGE